MKKKSIWDDQPAIDEFLREQEVGHLTTIDGEGWPHTVPVNFLWHGGAVFIHGGPGVKIENLRANPKVAFAVTEALGLVTVDLTGSPCQDTQLGRSVLIQGPAREIKNPDQKLRVLNRLIAKYDPAAEGRFESGHFTPEGLADQSVFHHCLVVEIQAQNLTARRQILLGKPEKFRKTAAAFFQRRGHELMSSRDLKTAMLINQSLDQEL